MSEELVMSLSSEALKTMLLVAGPMLCTAMVVGILVSVMQAVTQINEATLTFIPKMIAVVAIVAVFGPWMMEVMLHYASDILGNAGEWIR